MTLGQRAFTFVDRATPVRPLLERAVLMVHGEFWIHLTVHYLSGGVYSIWLASKKEIQETIIRLTDSLVNFCHKQKVVLSGLEEIAYLEQQVITLD